jgi:hypothetical protein
MGWASCHGGSKSIFFFPEILEFAGGFSMDVATSRPGCLSSVVIYRLSLRSCSSDPFHVAFLRENMEIDVIFAFDWRAKNSGPLFRLIVGRVN